RLGAENLFTLIRGRKLARVFDASLLEHFVTDGGALPVLLTRASHFGTTSFSSPWGARDLAVGMAVALPAGAERSYLLKELRQPGFGWAPSDGNTMKQAKTTGATNRFCQ